MFYVGLKIHSTQISVCVLSETGQPVRRNEVRSIEEMARLLEGLPDRFEVSEKASCSHAVCSCFYPFLTPATLSDTRVELDRVSGSGEIDNMRGSGILAAYAK
jgi:hypothetical protein